MDYLGDAALVAKLRSLPDFPALKAFLVEVLEPPPRLAKAQGGQATPNKRKVRLVGSCMVLLMIGQCISFSWPEVAQVAATAADLRGGCLSPLMLH